MYYRMKQAAEMAGLEPHVLRFWEGEFSQLKPKKNRAGHRLFRQEDIDLILKIKRLLHEEGYTVSGAKKKLTEGGDSVSRPEPAIVKHKLKTEIREVKTLLQNVINMLDPPG